MNRFLAVLLFAATAALGAACEGGAEESTPIAEGTATPDMGPVAGQVRITHYGHSMFAVESPGGVVILTDPNEDIGYGKPEEEIDLVTVSHDHFDHDKVSVAPGARVVRGLTDDGDWGNIDETIGDVRVRTFPSFHDDKEGAERGKNAIFVLDIGDWRIVHAGDLGHTLSPELIQSLKHVDVLMLPIGGHFTIGRYEADRTITDLEPVRVIPMHYRTEGPVDYPTNFPNADKMGTLEDFLIWKELTTIGGPCLSPSGSETLTFSKTDLLLLPEYPTTIMPMCP